MTERGGGPAGPDDRATVAFVHIHKTGGTSYGRLLAEALPGDHWFPPVGRGMTPEEAHEAFDPELARGCTLVAGHLDFDICRRAPFLRPVTLLRDPIDRLISAYHFSLLGDVPDTEAWREHLLRHEVSLLDFLLDDEMMAAVTTSTVLQLAGCLWSGQPRPADDEELVARAIANLRACAHVGIHERFTDSARLLGRELGIATDDVPPHLNASGGRAVELPDDLRARLEERLSLEYRLYRAGCALFEERFAASGLTPAPVVPTVRTPIPERPAPSGIGDWIELESEPPAGTALGAHFHDVVPVAALRLDRVVDRSGTSLVADRDAVPGVGVNWVAVPRGLYQAEVTLWCGPGDDDGAGEDGAGVDWVVGLNLAWCRADPFWRSADAAIPGLPARLDVILARVLQVPADLPVPARRSVPLTTGGLIRVPGDGHLCLLMGSNRTVRTTAGDRLSLLLVKVG